MKILLIEDDQATAKLIKATLISKHYVVDIATDGQIGLNLAAAFPYDLLLVDVMLPKVDGIKFCKELRQRDKKIPIILLTAEDSKEKKIIGLNAGADDYLVKPFDSNELIARIRTLMRRGSYSNSPVIEWEGLCLDTITCEVTYNDQTLRLTPKEYSLLELFLRNRRRIFSRSAIVEYLWSFENPPDEESVRAHIKGLRQKLRSAGATNDLIETVYGLGYRLKSVIQKDKPSNLPILISEEKQFSQPAPDKLAEIWENSQQKYRNPISILEQATQALLRHNLDNSLQLKAIEAAHKLAESLGSYCLMESSRLAKELQCQFQAEVSKFSQEQILKVCELLVALRRELQRYQNQSASLISSVHQQNLLLIVDDNVELTEPLALEATLWGMQTEIATNLAQARAIISRTPPDIVLLELDFADTGENGINLLAEMSISDWQVPIVVFTAKSNFVERIKVSRLGAQKFLQKPLAASIVIEAIAQVLSDTQKITAEILLVDDDQEMLESLKILLQPWGIHLTLLAEPEKVCQALESITPDLIILDIEMPAINGIDLCQVIRNDLLWQNIPVLFLSDRNDTDTIQRAFAVGADDFITKPINGSELLIKIFNRLKRSHYTLHSTQSQTTSLNFVAAQNIEPKPSLSLSKSILHNEVMKCPVCQSLQVSKNGYRRQKQCYLCKQCGRQFVPTPNRGKYSQPLQQQCLQMYRDGLSLRKIERQTGVNHNTISRWIKQAGTNSESFSKTVN